MIVGPHGGCNPWVFSLSAGPRDVTREFPRKNSMGSDNPQILSLLSQQLQNELQYERYKHLDPGRRFAMVDS